MTEETKDGDGLSGADALREDAKLALELHEELLQMAVEARTDIFKFYDFVLRKVDADEPVRIKDAPHHALMLEFLLYEHHRECVLLAPAGAGKCLEGGTLIPDPITGVRHPISWFVRRGRGSRVFGWSSEGGIRSSVVSQKIVSGEKECVCAALHSGRSLVATEDHPVLTPDGWKRLHDVVPGETIASAGRIPGPKSPRRLPPPVVDLLALLLSEGNTTHQRVGFSTADPTIREVAEVAASGVGGRLVRTKNRPYDYTFVRTTPGGGSNRDKNPAKEIAKLYGLQGKSAREKTIPGAIFRLPQEQLARFLAVFWMCDGYVSGRDVGVTLASEKMVEQLQHLLLRFGVQSRVAYKLAKCGEKYFDAWRLTVSAKSVEAMRAAVPLWGEKGRRLVVCAMESQGTQIVGVPVVSDDFVRMLCADVETSGVEKSDFLRRLGWGPRARTWREYLFRSPKGRRIQMTPFRELLLMSEDLKSKYGWLLSPDIHWDVVETIRPVGLQEVYDLCVPETSCFVANDLIVHNSFVTLCYTLWRIGHNPSERGVIVSATQQQASKVVSLVRRYIDESPYLRMVFPHLRRGQRAGESWTDTELTVDRPAGIKDPTLAAFGIETGGVLGSRLNWVLGDDILNEENTSTPAAREKVRTKWQSSFLSRLSKQDKTAKAALVNTPWQAEDCVEMAAKPPADDGTGGMGWASLRMDAYGDITVTDDVKVSFGWQPAWDSPAIRPANDDADDPRVRLVAHDPDPENDKTLWSVKWPTTQDLDRERVGILPAVFNQTRRCLVRDDESAMCPVAYVHTSLRVAKALGVRGMAADLEAAAKAGGPYIGIFTGVDPAFTEGDASDFSAIFTFGTREDGIKVVLDLAFGKWPPPVLAQKVAEVQGRFDSVVGVESNAGGGPIISFMRALGTSFPLKALRTGSEKWSPEHGVATFFAEMEQGDWAFPSARPPAVEKLIEDCLNYVPTRHTSDLLMANFVARKLAKKFGGLYGRGAKAEARARENAQRHGDLRKTIELHRARGRGPGFGSLLSR